MAACLVSGMSEIWLREIDVFLFEEGRPVLPYPAAEHSPSLTRVE
jgi:hypothetical protein